MPATACVLALLAVAGCGDQESGDSASGSELAGFAPAGAPVYAEAVVRPQGDQRADVEAALGTLLGTEDPGALILTRLDQEAEADGSGIGFSEDVLPWLGERAAFFAQDFGESSADGSYAAIVETTDPEAAADLNRTVVEENGEDFVEKTYDGVDYLLEQDEDLGASGIVDDHLVAGTEDGFRAVVDAAAGESLADSDALPEEFDRLGSDVMLAAYADPGAVLDGLEASGELPAEQREAVEAQLGIGIDEPLTAALGADSSSFFFETSSSPAANSPAAAPDLLAALPASSWVALSAGDVGAALDAAISGFDAQLEAAPAVPRELRGGLEAAAGRELDLDLKELTGWIGDVAFYFRGTSIFGLGGALIVETSDEAATLEALDSLRAVLDRDPSVEIQPLELEGEGFEVALLGAPVQIPIVVRDGRLVAGLGSESVEEAFGAEEPLGDSDGFSAASAELDDLEPSFYFDFEPLVELIESTGQAADDPGYAEAKPYLDALDFLVFGQALDDERLRFRVSLGLDQGTE